MKPKPDHFSLTALRKSINEHASPLFTLTKSEMEGLVSRLEKARDFVVEDLNSGLCGDRQDWLASLEPSK